MKNPKYRQPITKEPEGWLKKCTSINPKTLLAAPFLVSNYTHFTQAAFSQSQGGPINFFLLQNSHSSIKSSNPLPG